jgi:hypothetical protein
MTRIVCKEDCGNAPKKLQIRELLTAMAKANASGILKHLAGDVVLESVGVGCIEGRAAAAAHFTYEKRGPAAELVIHSILTHGPAAAANGVITAADGRRYAFSEFYHFTGSARGARIRAILSYTIPL